MSYVYLIKTRESIKLNEPIYKIGRTSQNGLLRLNQYPKGSELLLHIKCPNCNELEKIISNEFKKKFAQYLDYGTEYFEGDCEQMIDIIVMLVKKQKEYYINETNKKNTNNSKIKNTDNTNNNGVVFKNDNSINDSGDVENNDSIVNNNDVKNIDDIKNSNTTNTNQNIDVELGKYNCLQCLKNFKTSNGLWKHNKKYHTPYQQGKLKKNSICDNCGKQLADRHSKWRHEKICKVKTLNEKDKMITNMKLEFEKEMLKVKEEINIIKKTKILEIEV